MASKKEFAIRVPLTNNDNLKRYSLLRFNGTLKVDPGNWVNEKIKLAREDNRSQVPTTDIVQEYGEGTEYGKAARDEARRKRYGRQARTYNHDKQPWLMSITDADGREKKFRSIRENGAGEHSDYWVFLKAGDEFHAHKITDWYQFLPCVKHKTLDIDEAEEQFQQRNRVMNQFALKAQIQQHIRNKDELDNESGSKLLKIKDEASSDDEEGDDDLDGEDEGTKSKKKKGKVVDLEKERKRTKKQRVETADQVAAYESEDGDDEGREYDYISDSGSDTDREEQTVDEKMQEALVSVGDEKALRDVLGSEESESDEENEENESNDEEEKGEKTRKKLKGQNANKNELSSQTSKNKNGGNEDGGDAAINGGGSSESDEDPDSDNVSSVLFMQRKDIRKRPIGGDEPSGSGGSSQTATTGTSQSGRANSIPSSNNNNNNNELAIKRARVEEKPCDMPIAQLAAHSAAEALDEEMIRRLLQRKPHTTKELLNKVKPRCNQMNKTEIVAKLASILKKIEPNQFRQKKDGKEVLYFSLNQTK